MKKQNSNIDDLFNQARRQPPVFTKDDARSLVENYADKGIAHNHFNLRKLTGVRPMNILIASLAAAGAVSFFALNPFDSSPQPPNQATDRAGNHPVSAPVQTGVNTSSQVPDPASVPRNQDGQQPADKKVIIHKVVIDNGNNIDNHLPPPPPHLEFSRIDIKGVNLIDIDDSKLPDLGLKKTDSGLKFWIVGNGSSKPMLCTLLVRGGLEFNENSKTDDLPPVKLRPLLITDNAGNRRLSAFEDAIVSNYTSQSEVPDNSGNGKKIMNTVQNVIVSNDDSAGAGRPPHPFNGTLPPGIQLRIDGGDSNWTKQFREFNIQLDTMLKGRLEDVGKMLEKLNIDKGNFRQFILPPFPPPGKMDKETRQIEKQARDLEKQARDLERQALDIEKQALKTDKDARSRNNKQSLLDKSSQLREKAASIREKAYDLREKAYDLREKAFELREKQFDSIDSLDFNFDMNFDDFHIPGKEMDININDIINDVRIKVNSNIEPIMSRINLMEDNINNLVKVNKLVPVVVHMGKNPDRNFFNNNDDFDFILWYEPTEEFLKVLPDDVRSRIEPEVKALQTSGNMCQSSPVAADEAYLDIWRSCNGAVENLAVFPNPASDFINVKYNLSQARDVEISLHDLSGRIIRQLGKSDMCPSGSVDIKFDLKDIQPGMYLVSVQTDKNEQAVQRVIIER